MRWSHPGTQSPAHRYLMIFVEWMSKWMDNIRDVDVKVWRITRWRLPSGSSGHLRDRARSELWQWRSWGNWRNRPSCVQWPRSMLLGQAQPEGSQEGNRRKTFPQDQKPGKEQVKEKRSSLQISVTWSETQLGKGFLPWQTRDQAGLSRHSRLVGLISEIWRPPWAGSQQDEIKTTAFTKISGPWESMCSSQTVWATGMKAHTMARFPPPKFPFVPRLLCFFKFISFICCVT